MISAVASTSRLLSLSKMRAYWRGGGHKGGAGLAVWLCVGGCGGSHSRLLPHLSAEVSAYPSNDIIHHHQLLADKEKWHGLHLENMEKKKKNSDSDNHSVQSVSRKKKKKKIKSCGSSIPPPLQSWFRGIYSKTSHNSPHSVSSIQICSFSLAQYSIQRALC